MKKYLLLLFIIACIGIVIPHKLYATDITVGASTWYSWWDGEFQGDDKIDPAFLYGPALSVKFNDDFNLTFVYLYGKYDIKGIARDSGDPYKAKLKRKDCDLALNYRLNDIFKVFGGIKYLGASAAAMGFDWYGWGPGLGLSATFPVAENLFLLGTLSGFHLWTKEDGDGGDDRGKGYGINTTLSLAYYIAPASTTLSLGGRYQYLDSGYDNSSDDGPPKQKFYGVTLTATYTFSI